MCTHACASVFSIDSPPLHDRASVSCEPPGGRGSGGKQPLNASSPVATLLFYTLPAFSLSPFCVLFLIDKLELAAAANAVAGLSRCARTHTHQLLAAELTSPIHTADGGATTTSTTSYYHECSLNHGRCDHNFFLRRLDVTKPNVVLVWNGLLKWIEVKGNRLRLTSKRV